MRTLEQSVLSGALAALPACAVLLVSGCAAGVAGRSLLVVGRPETVLQAARAEFRWEQIPLAGPSGTRLQSELFDPGRYWSVDEIAERLDCENEAGERLVPAGRLSLRIELRADSRGEQMADELPGTRPLRRVLPQSVLSIRSSGRMRQDDVQGECRLSELYADALLRRIASRLPPADGVRQVTGS